MDYGFNLSLGIRQETICVRPERTKLLCGSRFALLIELKIDRPRPHVSLKVLALNICGSGF